MRGIHTKVSCRQQRVCVCVLPVEVFHWCVLPCFRRRMLHRQPLIIPEPGGVGFHHAVAILSCCRVRDTAIVVAVDEPPEEGLDQPLRLEKLANEVRALPLQCGHCSYSSYCLLVAEGQLTLKVCHNNKATSLDKQLHHCTACPSWTEWIASPNSRHSCTPAAAHHSQHC
jgi:hypothetical protein